MVPMHNGPACDLTCIAWPMIDYNRFTFLNGADGASNDIPNRSLKDCVLSFKQLKHRAEISSFLHRFSVGTGPHELCNDNTGDSAEIEESAQLHDVQDIVCQHEKRRWYYTNKHPLKGRRAIGDIDYRLFEGRQILRLHREILLGGGGLECFGQGRPVFGRLRIAEGPLGRFWRFRGWRIIS